MIPVAAVLLSLCVYFFGFTNASPTPSPMDSNGNWNNNYNGHGGDSSWNYGSDELSAMYNGNNNESHWNYSGNPYQYQDHSMTSFASFGGAEGSSGGYQGSYPEASQYQGNTNYQDNSGYQDNSNGMSATPAFLESSGSAWEGMDDVMRADLIQVIKEHTYEDDKSAAKSLSEKLTYTLANQLLSGEKDEIEKAIETLGMVKKMTYASWISGIPNAKNRTKMLKAVGRATGFVGVHEVLNYGELSPQQAAQILKVVDNDEEILSIMDGVIEKYREKKRNVKKEQRVKKSGKGGRGSSSRME
jgi:hypothetical protein